MGKQKSIRLDGVFNPDGSYAYRDFPHFLRTYEAATSVLKSPEDYRRLTLAVLEESAANGVVYSECFISPDFCGGGELNAWREYLDAMMEASDEAGKSLGITLRGVVTCVRHFGPDQAKRAALCAAETRRGLDRRFRPWAAMKTGAARRISPIPLIWHARRGWR